MKRTSSEADGVNLGLLIVLMLLCFLIISVGTLWFRQTLYQDRSSFSELYFTAPTMLPNIISFLTPYNYDFTLRSREKEIADLNYIEGYELYALYDITESKYSCISAYREKIFLDWTNESLYNLLEQNRNSDVIEPLIVLPSFSRIINWSTYNLEFGFQPPVGKGYLVVFFADQEGIKYRITLDNVKNAVLLDDIIVSENLSIRDGNNKFTLSVDGVNISLIHNNAVLFRKEHPDTQNGSFGLYTQDAYYIIQNFLVYQESPIVIPDRGTVLHYSIGDSLLWENYHRVIGMRSRSTMMLRANEVWNQTIDCEKDSFYCEFFDLPNDITFFLDEKNLSAVIGTIPVINNINQVLYPRNRNISFIDWEAFNITFSHGAIPAGDRGTILLNFGEKWAIMITRNNSYFLRPHDEGIMIDEIRNPPKKNSTLENVTINVDSENIVLIINDELVFRRDSPEDYTSGNMEMHIKNHFVMVNPIHLNNQDPECNDPFSFVFCEVKLETFRTPSQRQSESFADYSIEYSRPEAPITDYFPPDEKNIPRLLEIPVENPFIPDKKVILDRPGSQVVNSSNFSLSYSYQTLDGARIVEIGFMDSRGDDVLVMTVFENEDSILFYYFEEGMPVTFSINHTVNSSMPHSAAITVQNLTATFLFDGRVIYKVPFNLTSGTFFVSARNTYAEFGNIFLNIRDRGISRVFRLNEDPCELKLVYRNTTEGNISISPGQAMNFKRQLNISEDFDYGKVFVQVYGSGGLNITEPLAIHFWFIRGDERHDP
jgi:hypothetical protein